MIKKYQLDNLNEKEVSVKITKYTDEGEQIGKVFRTTYNNSTAGRLQVQNDLPLAQQNAIFAIWGDTPTVY